MDRFDDMAVFQIIARTLTISATANELGLAPSAVSRRLKALEERLGVQLVQRTTRQLTLTRAGEEYLAGGREILAALEGLEGGLQAGAGTLAGSIRLTAPLSFGLLKLPDILDRFMRQHPGVELDIHLSDGRVDLVAEGLDMALRIGDPGASSLIARRLCEVKCVVCASPDFLQAHPGLSHPSAMAGLPGCVYTNDGQPAVLAWTDPDGTPGQVTLEPVVRANNGDFLCDMAVRGHGVVFGPKFILEPALEAGQLATVCTEVNWPSLDLYAVYPPTAHVTARLRAFLDHVAKSFRQRGAG